MAATRAEQRGEYNIERNGLCLIVAAYCVEAIQQVLYAN
jgi:hypothetical protein